jgi:AraC family transcriptional regulator
MNLVSINRLCYPSCFQQDPHAHEQTQVTLVVSGQMVEIVDGERRVYEPLDLVIKPAGTIHSNNFGADGTETLQVCFDPKVLENSFGTSRINSYQHLFCSELNHIVLQIFASLNRNQSLTNSWSYNVLNQIVPKLEGVAHPDRPASPPGWLKSAIDMMDDEAIDGLSVNQISSRVSRHRVSVTRAIRQHCGLSFKQMQQQKRIKHAAKLLTQTKQDLAMISIQSGFSDQSHMCRVFKKSTGLTPNQFRMLASSRKN